jgi:heat shock protein HslJ
MVQETRFLSLLPYARSVSLSDGRLNIRDAGGNTVLVFSPMVSQSSLTGSWHLSSYASGSSSLIPVTSGTSITATFGNDGRLSGSAGCNQYSSTYTTSRSSFTVGQVATTLLFCDEPAGIMEQENRFLALLPSVTHYQVSGRQLILTDAADEKALVFTRQ